MVTPWRPRLRTLYRHPPPQNCCVNLLKFTRWERLTRESTRKMSYASGQHVSVWICLRQQVSVWCDEIKMQGNHTQVQSTCIQHLLVKTHNLKVFCGNSSATFNWTLLWFRWMSPSLIIPIECGQAWGSRAVQKWIGTLIILFTANETDSNLLSSSMVNIGNINTQCCAMCMQTVDSSTKKRSKLPSTIIPTSHHRKPSPLNSQILVFISLFLSCNVSPFSIPCFEHFSLSPLSCLLCWCCSRHNDITPLLVDCSVVKTHQVRVCVCVWRRPEINILTIKLHCKGQLDLKNQHFHKRLNVCVCLFVSFLSGISLNMCVCVKERNKTFWSTDKKGEMLECSKQTLKTVKL